MRPVDALYKNGLLRPVSPLPLRSGERVAIIVVRRPDSRRWDVARLVAHADDDLALAFQMRAIPKACIKTRMRALTVEEFAELDLATDEAVGRVEPVTDPE